ncbi:MAG: DUF5362 domain-containing protein, partial [Verrucomicrobiae bacterium]|nr:DUF5362 domain-containing protein [Verrucomicrobiae bacterium]
SGKAGARGKAAAEEVEESEESVDLVKSLASVLVARSGWIKFVGVMTIIAGVFLCLSIVGALVGWIPIWMGTVLFRATGALEQAAFFGRRSDLEEVLFRVGSFFKLNGVFILAYMAFVIMIYGLIFVLGFASMIAHPELIQPELTPSVGPE